MDGCQWLLYATTTDIHGGWMSVVVALTSTVPQPYLTLHFCLFVCQSHLSGVHGRCSTILRRQCELMCQQLSGIALKCGVSCVYGLAVNVA